MAFDIDDLPDAVTAFLHERHLASLTLVRPDGTPHVTPVGFTWDPDARLARIITWSGSVKARLLERSGELRAALCQVDGGRWLTLEGPAAVTGDAARCADAVARYAARYSPPKDRGPDRRTVEITVDAMRGRA
ncbi:MAG: TIGR03618 family F420-dependent PPOX class oxidoreductase [Acidimicrobiales bacterium]|nr:TIGR03618 family F420-dependent PPOX class oxidoreductase [Acidimicrobiales bacterium]